ncbi:MAG: hypothetical protein U9Q85_01430 [Patescibacteria group bacterium]|nr:hypothetical protein [Patescibacteria group bacterium]
MLNKLFGSQARVKILKLFLSHPSEKFYIRQISRDLKLQLNSVRRELDNLEQFGLLMSNPEDISEEDLEALTREDFIKQINPKDKKKTKNKNISLKYEKKYYQVDRTFILYSEIKDLIIKAQLLYEKDFVNELQKTGNVKLLILSGFFVNDREKSVDLFVVGRFNRRRLNRLIKDLENDLGREINFTIMSIGEFKYRRDITDVFLFDILEGKKIAVIDELGAT